MSFEFVLTRQGYESIRTVKHFPILERTHDTLRVLLNGLKTFFEMLFNVSYTDLFAMINKIGIGYQMNL